MTLWTVEQSLRHVFSALCFFALAAVGLAWLPVVCEKDYFPLAECNEISGKCFSHTLLGPGVG